MDTFRVENFNETQTSWFPRESGAVAGLLEMRGCLRGVSANDSYVF